MCASSVRLRTDDAQSFMKIQIFDLIQFKCLAKSPAVHEKSFDQNLDTEKAF